MFFFKYIFYTFFIIILVSFYIVFFPEQFFFCASFRCLRRRVACEDLVQQKGRCSGTNGWATSSPSGWVFRIYCNNYTVFSTMTFLFRPLTTTIQTLAMLHLDKVRLYGKYIRVMQSKYQTVQLPKEGQPDSGLTKDYTSSPLHRFKKPGSKNYQNIYPPSSTLHLSNIPWAF